MLAIQYHSKFYQRSKIRNRTMIFVNINAIYINFISLYNFFFAKFQIIRIKTDII